MKRVLIKPKETQQMYDGFHFSQANRVGDKIWIQGKSASTTNSFRPAEWLRRPASRSKV